MSRSQQVFGFAVALVVALGLGYAGWRVRTTSQAESCQACGRAVHANMRTVAFMGGGKREVFCCPTCALSEATQLHKTIRFDTVADYDGGRALRPTDAFAVEGSDVIPCIHQHEMRNKDGLTVPMAFDRCSPSILAFASRAAAEQFAAEHGGKVGAFQELIAPHMASASAAH